jgi:hypothetical protein
MESEKVLKAIFVIVFNLVLINAFPSKEVPRTDIKPGEMIRVNETVKRTSSYNTNFPWDTFCTDFQVPDLTVRKLLM